MKNRKTLKFEYLNILENLEVALFKTLTKKLKEECKTTEELRNVFKNTSKQFSDDEKFKLMTSKGIYP